MRGIKTTHQLQQQKSWQHTETSILCNEIINSRYAVKEIATNERGLRTMYRDTVTNTSSRIIKTIIKRKKKKTTIRIL